MLQRRMTGVFNLIIYRGEIRGFSMDFDKFAIKFIIFKNFQRIYGKTIEKILKIDYNRNRQYLQKNFLHILRRKDMNLKARQEKLDVIKWYDSILWGEDRCGTYEYCAKCNKDEQYPCARAEARFEKKYVRVAQVSRRAK